MTDSLNSTCDIQVPGYKLEKLLGAGGYGEVWQASAPGGLNKAVKLIFGYHNEKRAASELRSLEKIKEVRHPFLLSLERIEIIEGRLVIVTELADASLKDRFDHFLRDGKSGIPREELLGYLRDSADALDYLSDHHSLQHLDVKPENLLLLAGHVKVADFGLVKEIQETQASLVGGMTPLYSAPEVFQGKPTCFSDQYSLAVLYQEMLTGCLPFDGATSAELTLQHMHDDPSLDALPLGDRYVLSRALAKDPQQRYASCRDFVQALINVDVHGAGGANVWSSRPVVQQQVPSTKPSDPRKSRPGTMTQVFEDDLVNDPEDVSDSMLLDLPTVLRSEPTELPAMDLQAADFRPTPALVIGIGGTAGNVLSQLRQCVKNRYGVECNVPALQLLLFDTDKNALMECTHGTADVGLTSEETLSLQLRRPQEYRDSSKRLLSWLSRRWLYNIPKSLKTEGLRPLGRLAFADHARRTIQRIRLALSQTMDESSLDQSREQTGLDFDPQAVRVYVVASISGGTGSGMSIDLGYAVQGLLKKLGIENAKTTGVFLHSTGRDSRFCDLAKVNAFSWFKEYHHFARPEGFYPGDEASGLPALDADTPAFDNTYFTHLGDGLSTEQLKEHTNAVAQYLMLDTLTPAQIFFEASREALPSTVSGCPALRTFGLHEESAASQELLEVVAEHLCQRVVLSWSGGESDSAGVAEEDTASISDTSQIVSGAPQAVAQLQINLEGISANARTILENQFGSDPEPLLTKLVTEERQAGFATLPGDVLKTVDTLFAAPSGSERSAQEFVFGRPLESVVSPLGMKLSTDLQRWLLHRLDVGQERLAGTRQAAEWFASHLQRVEKDAHRLVGVISKKIVMLLNSCNSPDSSKLSHEQVLELGIKYFRLRVDARALQATGHLVRMLQAELKSVGEAIIEFGRHLRHLADKVTLELGQELEAREERVALVTADPVGRILMAKLSDLVSHIDHQVQQDFIDPQGGLFQTVMGSRKVNSNLLDSLHRIARDQIALAVREITQSGDQCLDPRQLAQHADSARPALLDLGGSSSHLAILPQKDESAELANCVRGALGAETSVLTGTGSNLVVCCEGGELPLARVAIDLIECRRDYSEFADRVHTRNDISWAPLIDLKPAAPSTSSEYATQVLSQVL